MAIVGLHHVQLAMPAGGEEEARRFYGDLFGLAERGKPPAQAMRGGCWFEDRAVRVHLGVEKDFRPARKAHPALQVDDLTALCERLATAGFRITPDDPLDGHKRCFVDDPFGNRIELLQA